MSTLHLINELISTVSSNICDAKEEKTHENNEEFIQHIKSQAAQYIKWESNELFRKQVSHALSTNNVDELQSMFAKRISFGTAGLRSKMKGGYAFMNDLVIIQTVQGLIRYTETQMDPKECHKRGVIIGYDARHHSSRFAQIACSIFLQNGFKIYWFNRYAATPFIPYGILSLNCCLGIVVTASHNPKYDNGFKVYWNNGSQIIPPHDVAIAASILTQLQPWYEGDIIAEMDPYNIDKHQHMTQDITDLVTNAYFKECSARYSYISDADKQYEQLPIVFTPMHGIGGYWMEKCYQAFKLPMFIKVAAQHEPDPDFSTVDFPNPEEGAGALKLSMETADKHGCKLILANDPDSDRFTMAEKVDNEWYLFNGNEIAVLLSNWYFTNYMKQNKNVDRSKLCMIASTVSSKYLQSMAEKEGFVFVDTLTGFKWMGNTAIDMINEGYIFLFAYEVEIGFLIGDSSFDKDGIRTAALFNEMAIDLYKNEKKTCYDKLNELRAKYGYFEMMAAYRRMDDASLMNKMKRLRNWNANNNDKEYPQYMGEFKIVRVRDVTTGYDSGEKNKISKLPKQINQQMITFWFENGATATLRNSGTEPKLKFYVETKDDKDPQTAKNLLKRMTDALLKEFMQMP